MSESKTEMVKLNNDIDIPKEMKKYEKQIILVEQKIEHLVENTLDGFQESDIMVFIIALGSIFAKMRNVVDNLKSVDANDRVAIYNIIIANVIKRVIQRSDKLSDEQKETVRNYFAENGVVTTILNNLNELYINELDKMDTNDDDEVSKDEFKQYVKNKCCDSEGCAECCLSCCFPILSFGKSKIKIKK